MQQQTFRTVNKVFSPKIVPEGVGASVRRVIGSREVPRLDPFLMLDYFSGKLPGGFPDHPHRGFETVTYMQQGKIYHEDFLGNKGILEPGDIQWMTAGKGIVHAEMPGSFDEPSIGMQLWVNLKANEKFQNPAYQEIKKEKLPKMQKDGVSVVLIAGEALGQKGPIFTRTPSYYLDFKLEKNSKHVQQIPQNWNALAFVYQGEAIFGGNKMIAKADQGVLISQENTEDFIIETKNDTCGFILLAGKPINEPVFWNGPFVLDTQEKLDQTFYDYHNAINGFENAATWESKIQYMAKKK